MFKDTKAKIFVQQNNKAPSLEKRLFYRQVGITCRHDGDTATPSVPP